MNFWSRLGSCFRKGKFDADMSEEMRLHLEQRMREQIAAGLSPDEARYAALRKFGGVEQAKESARAQRGWVGLEQLGQDVRFAARGLRKSPGFTVIAALTLGFGIGINTSMFTALQSVLMRELPFPDSKRLVQVFRTSPHSQRWPHAPANFLDQQARNDVFDRMAAFIGKQFNFAEPGQPAERVGGVQVTADVFPLLGVQPAIGRVFTAEEDRPGHNRVAVLDHGFWLRRFAGDPGILGRTLRLDGESVTVIGVMPATFRDRPLFGTSDIWTPLAFSDAQRKNRGGNFLKSVARLKGGVSATQAQAAMDLLAAQQAREHPDANTGIGLRLVPLVDTMDPRGRTVLWLTMALAGFVLLIACANLANLQFARTARRTRELAIRGALGAPRGRILRQLLTESLLIALLGGALGLVLAHWGNELLSQQINKSGELVFGLNWRVLGFALCAVTLSGFAFGLVPAWVASRTNASEAMKQGSRGAMGDRSRHRMQHTLIVGEVALALVLLTGAGLVVRGLQRFTQRDPGWAVDGLTVGHVNLPEGKYGGGNAQRRFVDRLREKLGALPGVECAAVAWSLPLREFDTAGGFVIEGRPAPARGHEPIRHVDAVTPGFFQTFKIRLLAGRDFNAGDSAGRPGVVIINEAMARAFWPDASPVGQRVDGEEVVGVVSDVRFATDPGDPVTRFQTYRPLAQAPRGGRLWFALRGLATVEMLRQTVAEVDADLPVIDAGSARATVDVALAKLSQVGWLLSGFGGLGLLLAALGIYGVIAGFVSQRTNEIGVRMALGAQMRDVLQLVVGKGLRLAVLGTAIGLAGAVGLTRVLMSVAPGLSGSEPRTIAGVAALLVGVAVLACWLPARRAARIDPATALRSE